MTDVRTKALALAALENNVELWHRSDIDQYVAVMWDKGNRYERMLKRGFENLDLLHRYAEAAKVLNLEPDQTVMMLLEVCEFALEGENFLNMCGYESPSFRWDCKEWRKTLALMARRAIAKARGEVADG